MNRSWYPMWILSTLGRAVPWWMMKQTCSCGLPPFSEVLLKFENNPHKTMDFSCSDFPNNCNLLQFNTLHGATPPVQWCRPCLDDDAPTIPNLRLVRVGGCSHPVHNVLCDWVGSWWCSLNFTKFSKVPTCWFQGTYAHLQHPCLSHGQEQCSDQHHDGWGSRRAPVDFHPFQRFCSNLGKTPIKRWISVCSILEQTATSCSSTLYMVQLHLYSGADLIGWWCHWPRPLSPIVLGSMLLTLPNLVKFQPSDFKALTRIFSINNREPDFSLDLNLQGFPACFSILPSVTLQNATPPVQRCRPASLMMMTDHYTIGVMPVSSSQRPTKASWPRFQSCKCLVVRYLRSSVQDVQEESPYLLHICIYLYAFIILYIKRYSSPCKG